MLSIKYFFLYLGKPNPPCFITMNRSMFNMEWPFKYQLTYHSSMAGYCPPEASGTTYVTEILIQHNSNKKLCTCQKDVGFLNFDTTDMELDLLTTYEKLISFRAALSIDGVLSDFRPFVNRTTNSCELSLVVDSKSCWLGYCKFLDMPWVGILNRMHEHLWGKHFVSLFSQCNTALHCVISE